MTVPDDDFTAALLAALAELDAPQGVSPAAPRQAPGAARQRRAAPPAPARRRRAGRHAGAGMGARGPGWRPLAGPSHRDRARAGGGQQRGADACTMPAAAGGPGARGGEDGEGDEAAAAPVPEPVVARAVQRHAGVSGDLPAATGATPEDALAWLDDAVASEVPVALVFNGLSHAVMMATPTDLQAFALGFALSGGLIDTPADCRGIEVFSRSGPQAGGGGVACEVHLEIATRCFARLKERRRALAGRTGCGLCGIDSLQALDLVPERVRARPLGRGAAGRRGAARGGRHAGPAGAERRRGRPACRGLGHAGGRTHRPAGGRGAPQRARQADRPPHPAGALRRGRLRRDVQPRQLRAGAQMRPARHPPCSPPSPHPPPWPWTWRRRPASRSGACAARRVPCATRPAPIPERSRHRPAGLPVPHPGTRIARTGGRAAAPRWRPDPPFLQEAHSL